LTREEREEFKEGRKGGGGGTAFPTLGERGRNGDSFRPPFKKRKEENLSLEKKRVSARRRKTQGGFRKRGGELIDRE